MLQQCFHSLTDSQLSIDNYFREKKKEQIDFKCVQVYFFFDGMDFRLSCSSNFAKLSIQHCYYEKFFFNNFFFYGKGPVFG